MPKEPDRNLVAPFAEPVCLSVWILCERVMEERPGSSLKAVVPCTGASPRGWWRGVDRHWWQTGGGGGGETKLTLLMASFDPAVEQNELKFNK